MLRPVDSDVAPQASDQQATPGATPAGGPQRRTHASPSSDRHRHLALVTMKLVVFTVISLIVIACVVYKAQAEWKRSFLVLIVFGAGLVGGFVSLQQRLPKISAADLKRLSESWFAILLVPVNGGIFAIVLHLAFLGEIVQGGLFPAYPVLSEASKSGAETLVIWMRDVAPASSAELGKLIFWAFVAGFSERLVPQILQDKLGSARDEPQPAPSTAEHSQAPREEQSKPVGLG